MAKCSKEHLASFIRLRRVILLRSDIWNKSKRYCLRQFLANKISLKPKGFYITLPQGKITL